MFVIGLDIRISWINDGSNDWNNAITLSTHENGLCDTSFGGDNKYKANAMLVKLQAGTRYKIDFNKIDTIKIEYSAPICTPDGCTK